MTSLRSDVAHLYRRAGFGATPAQLDAAVAAGYPATVDALVAGTGTVPDPTGDRLAPPTFAPYHPPTAPAHSSQARSEARSELATERQELAPLQAWWMNRMIATSTPLREKLALLWHGHFATGVSKVHDPHLMYLQNQLFRTAGAGSFETLTQAVAKDGAMMIWLDTEKDKRDSPNENFARELMERFTIGVGNYSQEDVRQGARCFTGWVYDRAADQWRLQGRQHDDGIKTFLGRTGDLSGEDAVSTILARPESARFVIASLWSGLAYPVAPSDPVVTDLLPAYVPAKNIGEVLRALFTHPLFLSPAARTGLVKQPIEYLVGAARALGVDADLNSTATGGASTVSSPGTGPGTASRAATGRRRTLAVLATAMAQTPFNPTNVGGWPPNGYWLNTATAVARLDAAALLADRGDLSTVESAPVSQRMAAAAQLLGVVDGWGPTTARALAPVQTDPKELVVLALNSPEYVLN